MGGGSERRGEDQRETETTVESWVLGRCPFLGIGDIMSPPPTPTFLLLHTALPLLRSSFFYGDVCLARWQRESQNFLCWDSA